MPASALAPSEAPTPAAAHGESPAPAPPSAPRAAVVRPTLVGAAIGGAQGALLYGGAIALLHARHNALGTWDALVLLGWCLLLYGAGAAGASGAAMLALRLVRRVRGAATTATRTAATTSARDAAPATTAATATAIPRDAAAAGLSRDLWLASAAFHFVFWLLASQLRPHLRRGAALGARRPGRCSATSCCAALVVLAAAAARRGCCWPSATRRRDAVVSAPCSRPSPCCSSAARLALALAHRGAPREKPPLPATFGARGGQRVAVVGVDGADWRVILPMVQRGELPHLARLMAEGSWGPLATFPDSNSAVIWASIYSGRRPAVHGVLDFYAIRLAGMSEATSSASTRCTARSSRSWRCACSGSASHACSRSTARSVAAPLIWEVASAARRSVGVVDGYYYSYPAPVLGDPRSFFLGYGSDGLWQQARKAKRAIGHDEAALQAWPPALLAAEGRFLALPDFTWQGAVLLDLLGRYAAAGPADALLARARRRAARSVALPRARRGSSASIRRRLPAHDGMARVLSRARRLPRPPARASRTGHRAGGGLRPRPQPHHLPQHGHPAPPRAARHPAAARRPGARRAAARRTGVLDVYPTLLYLLGIARPCRRRRARCSPPRSTRRSSRDTRQPASAAGTACRARAAPRRPTPSAGARSSRSSTRSATSADDPRQRGRAAAYGRSTHTSSPRSSTA